MLRQATSQKGHFGLKTSGYACGMPRHAYFKDSLKTRRPSSRASFPVHDDSQSYLQLSILSKTSSERDGIRQKRHGELSSWLLKLCQLPGPVVVRYSSSPTGKGPRAHLSAVTLSLDGGEQWAYRKTSPIFRGLFISFSQKAKRFELRTLWNRIHVAFLKPSD